VAAIWLLLNQYLYNFVGKIHKNILQKEIIPTEIQSNAADQFKPLEN
jgi:hypothetical protein